MSKSQVTLKKTIVVMKNRLKYRLFTEDLKKIIKVKIRKAPRLPKF
jgi:hypothetical protein